MGINSRNTLRTAVFFSSLALLPSWCMAEEPLSKTALRLQEKFSNAEEMLEYHFTLNVPPFTEKNMQQVFTEMREALKPIAQVGELGEAKAAAYIDTRDRVLDRVNLILRLRSNALTIKTRTTSLNKLIDLEPCQSIKYEKDFFEEPGFSISSEYKFKKNEWLSDPTKATVKQTMDFMQEKCPALAKQLEGYLKPIETLVAPGTAMMYTADVKIDHPQSGSIKEAGFSLWTFSESRYTLGEIAWVGRVKDKTTLDRIYSETREKLLKTGLLAKNQSSKTEQYFSVYYGEKTPQK